MKRPRAALIAALVISSSSFARFAEGARLTLPLAAKAQLCEAGSHSCHQQSLAAGSDLGEFIEQHADAAKRYRLSLQLPAGEFELHESWRIDGAALPASVTHLSITGSPPFTRLSGARALTALASRFRTVDGVTIAELLPSWRSELEPAEKYTSEEPGWPVLRDAGGALRMARWPREGWAEFSRGEATPARSIQPGDDAPVAGWRAERAAWVWGFFRFGWHAAYAPLGDIGEAGDLSLSGWIRYGLGEKGRYRVTNLRSAMREPGDYWMDIAAGQIQLRQREVQHAGPIHITMLSTPMMMLSRLASAEISGIEFVASRGDAITIANSTGVDLSQLKFEGIGRTAVVVDGGRNVRIRASTFEDLGDQAVILRGGDRITLEGSGHVVEDCHITRSSQRLLTPASAIRLEGTGHVVRRNRIDNVPHSAVYFEGNDHTIEANWFERTCLEVDDAGAIYGGRDWTARGTRIRHNVFTNIHAPATNGIGVAVYLDDMLSGIRVEDNAFVDVDYGVLVGGGRDNVVERNLFHRTKMSIHVDERARTWAQKAVAPGEVMDQRLNAVPVRSARWQAAYPALAAMLRERAAIPAGNVIGNNLAAASGAPNLVPSAIAAGTLQAPRELELPGEVQTAAELLAFCGRGATCDPFDSRSAARPSPAVLR